MKLIADFLVHSSGDDAHFGKGVGHRMDAHLRHEQRKQEDLVFLDIVILEADLSLNLKWYIALPLTNVYLKYMEQNTIQNKNTIIEGRGLVSKTKMLVI